MSDGEALQQVVVLAGGLGTRLGARGVNVPKVLQEVNGEPFLEHLFRVYAALGLSSVHLCLGHLAAEVLTYLDTSSCQGLEITHTRDRTPSGGTAHALRRAQPYLSDRFVLWLGDTYYSPSSAWFSALEKKKAPVMVLTDRCADVAPNAALRTDGSVVYEKQGGASYNLIDAGVACLDQSFLSDAALCDLSRLEDCWSALSKRRSLAGLHARSPVFDIGTPARIEALERHLKRREA